MRRQPTPRRSPRSRAGASLKPSGSPVLRLRRASRSRATPRHLDAAHLDLARELITRKSWWDTVDTLATKVVGSLVRRFPELVGEMDRWIADPDLWLRRSAILHQLEYGADTDVDRLFAYVERTMAEQDFFIRKAIGWALCQLARTDPDVVRAFVAQNESSLSSPLVREATKHLR